MSDTTDRVLQALTDTHPDTLTADRIAATLNLDLRTTNEALAELNADGHATPSDLTAGAVWMLHGAARTTAYAVWQTRPHDPVAGDADADADPARCTRCGLTTGDQIHTEEQP